MYFNDDWYTPKVDDDPEFMRFDCSFWDDIEGSEPKLGSDAWDKDGDSLDRLLETVCERDCKKYERSR